MVTIEEEIKDVEERIQNSTTEAYEKAFVIERGNQKFNGIFRLSLSAIAFITFGVMLFNLPAGGISELFANGQLGVFAASFVLGSTLAGVGINNLINVRKLDDYDLNLYDRYLFVRRIAERVRCDYEVKEMYERIEKLLNIHDYLSKKQKNEIGAIKQTSSPVAPMKQYESSLRESNIRKRKKG